MYPKSTRLMYPNLREKANVDFKHYTRCLPSSLVYWRSSATPEKGPALRGGKTSPLCVPSHASGSTLVKHEVLGLEVPVNAIAVM